MDIERIKSSVKVNEDTGCWEWTKSVTSAGYGQLTENKKYWTAHRYAFACVHGAPDPGLVIRHKCHVRRCCNPDHLEIGTHKDNWEDSAKEHKAAYEAKRTPITICGVSYSGIRKAKSATGLSWKSLKKFRSDGLFDEEAYRKSCAIAAVKPKI